MGTEVAKRFTQDEKDRMMLALALNGGGVTRTRQQLQEVGMEVSENSLRRMKDTERYTDLMEQHRPALERQLVGDVTALTKRALDVAALALEQTETDARDGKLKDPAKSAQALMTVAGIGVDKHAVLTGRPTQIVEHREGTEILRALAQKVPGLVIDGTVAELPRTTEARFET